jgi:hypothetical protein
MALVQSRYAIRSEFDKNRDVPVTETEHMEGLLLMIDEAEDMLRNQIVQGKLNEQTGHYRE